MSGLKEAAVWMLCNSSFHEELSTFRLEFGLGSKQEGRGKSLSWRPALICLCNIARDVFKFWVAADGIGYGVWLGGG